MFVEIALGFSFTQNFTLKMKKIIKTTRSELIRKSVSLKRDGWYCRRNKGNHSFVLVIPKYASWAKTNTPEEFYKMEEQELKTFAKVKYWRCTLCGKEEMDSEENPDKRIRNHLYEIPQGSK